MGKLAEQEKSHEYLFLNPAATAEMERNLLSKVLQVITFSHSSAPINTMKVFTQLLQAVSQITWGGAHDRHICQLKHFKQLQSAPSSSFDCVQVSSPPLDHVYMQCQEIKSNQEMAGETSWLTWRPSWSLKGTCEGGKGPEETRGAAGFSLGCSASSSNS